MLSKCGERLGSAAKINSTTATPQKTQIETAGVRYFGCTRWKALGKSCVPLIWHGTRELPKTPELLEMSSRIAPSTGT